MVGYLAHRLVAWWVDSMDSSMVVLSDSSMVECLVVH